jgi:hypothetical protein
MISSAQVPGATSVSVDKSWQAWLVIAAGLLAQYGLFTEMVRREVAWFVPTAHDQCKHIVLAYDVYEKLQSEGLFRGIKYGVTYPMPTGSLMEVMAALLCLGLGPSRLTVLTVNFLLFAGLQCSLAATLHWYARRWAVAFVGLGLLLTTCSPFLWIGGLFDARLDLGAFCLFGVFICLVLRSRVFVSRRWAVAVGSSAAALAFYRHIAAVYLSGIFLLYLGFCVARCLLNRVDIAACKVAWRQLTGVTISTSLFGLAFLLVPVLKFRCLWDYYVVGHAIGNEKGVRASEAGCVTLFDHLSYYALSLAKDHAGRLFLVIAALALIATLVLWLGRAGKGKQTHVGAWQLPSVPVRSLVFFLGVCFVVPYAILTSDVCKSPIVANILVMPLLWLVILPLLCVMRCPPGFGNRWARLVVTALAVLCTGGAVTAAALRQCHRFYWQQNTPESQAVLDFADDIAIYSHQADLTAPAISYNCIIDVLEARTVRIRAYEQHRRQVHPTVLMPIGVVAINEAEVLSYLDHSDFVVLSGPSAMSPEVYPFNQLMVSMAPQVRAYCEGKLIHCKRYVIRDATVDLYMRPYGVCHDQSTFGGKDRPEVHGHE